MENFNNRNLYPDDDWQSISQPVVKSEEEDSNFTSQEPKTEPKPKRHSKHPVLTFQLTVSLCVLLFLFIIKFLGTPLYTWVMTWYENEISKSVIYDGDFEGLDFSSLFATDDED